MAEQQQPAPATTEPSSSSLNGAAAVAGESSSSIGGTTRQQDRDVVDLGYASRPNGAAASAHQQQQGRHDDHDRNVSDGGDDNAKPKQSGLFGTSANLVNTIVGAGIIGIPYAFSKAGLIMGLILLAFVGYLTDKSLRLMIDLARFHPSLKNRHVTSFEKLAWFPYGRLGRYFVLANMFVLAYGAMVAYLLIIKDTVPTLLGVAHGMEGGAERELILIITSLLIMLPLSMQRDMATLALTSCISVTADIVLVIFILAFSPVKETVSNAGGIGQVLREDGVRPTLFIGLGVLSTAMACQHSAFIVSGSLSNLTRSRWAIVTGWSIGIATLCCALLGTAGYLGFLGETQGDVLNNFDADSVVANGARALLAITMFFTYPMESFVGRHVLSALVYNGDMEGTDDVVPVGCLPESDFFHRRAKLTLLIYIMTMIPALIFDDLGPVLSITGAIGGSCLAYIAPGLLYLGVNGGSFVEYAHGLLQRGWRRSRSAGGDGESGGGGSIELPVAGDSSQVLPESTIGTNGTPSESRELPVAGERRIASTSSPVEGCKPLWWYLFGFPIWYGIAQSGRHTMEENLAETTEEEARFQLSPNNSADEMEDTFPTPKGGDYCIAVMFVVFGVVACVAGLASNIYAISVGIDLPQA